MRRFIQLSLAAFGLLAASTGLASAAEPADPALIAKGEYLARVGDCVACHTVPRGAAFAGGYKMATPLGDIYATNITPDPETGIGTYSLEDFDRAMRKGIAKDGHMLYPAMPYPSYAKISPEDMKALYAFFMSLTPVRQENKPSEIPFPLNIRWPLKLWNLVFSADEIYQPQADKSAEWNRGAYLVQGLGHCGSCHTERGLLFQEKALDESEAKFLAGGLLDNWYASSLRGEPNTGLGRWSEDDVIEFLKTGHNQHATAFGTMIEVINNSSQFFTPEDLKSVAVYLKSLPAAQKEEPVYAYDPSTAENLRNGTDAGAALYVAQCIHCHAADGRGHRPWLPPLAGNPAVMERDPSSLINITINGSQKIVIDGMPDAYRMPQYRVLLTDDEIAEVLSFIRKSWGNKAGPVTAAQVRKLRDTTEPVSEEIVVLRMK